MTRTKLKDREMPVYTKKEEMFNMISHIVGGVVGIAGMVLCIIFSALHHNGYGLAGSIVFGVSMILLYTMSSVYHGLKPGMGKRVMQVFDHCTIYVLIAGTYTPLLLSAMRPIDPVASWVLLGIVWGLAAVGIAVTAIDLNKYKVFSMVCYMAIGWCIVFKLPLLIQAIGWGGFWLILGGGLAVLIEFLINLTFQIHETLFWSFYPMVAGVVLGLMLIVIAICKPLRESLHRKFFL